MADIELLKRLAEAAAQGEYESKQDWDDGDLFNVLAPTDLRVKAGPVMKTVATCDTPEQAEFFAAANPATVLALIAENERLREVLAEKLIDSTMLTGIDIGNGSLTIGAKGGVFGIMADSFGQMLFESGAENYIEAFFSSSKHPELGQIVVTVKRETGKTPHQLRQVAEAERDQLSAELERARKDAELLRKHLAECADSLESEILDRFGSSKDHPAMRRKFECDMQDVIDARAALGKGGGQNGSKTAETRASAGLEGGAEGGKGGRADA